MRFRKTMINLFHAIKTNNSEMVREILVSNPKLHNHPSCKDKKHATPLWDAMLQGNLDIVKLLIQEFNANPDEKCCMKNVFFTGYTYLHYVASCVRFSMRKAKVMEFLVRCGADVNSFRMYNVGTPLQLALDTGNSQCVEFLLQNGARLEGPEWFGPSPACLVFESQEDDSSCKELLLLLIKHGLNTRVRNNYGDNLLHLFYKLRIYRENISFPFVNKDTSGIVEILLDSGIPINEPDEYGNPLIYYVIEQDLELTSLLLKRGASVNNVMVHEYSLLFFVTTLSCDKKRMSLADLLLSNGADINAKSKNGWTALHGACIKECEKMIDFFIYKGADVSSMADTGDTPFYFLFARYQVSGNNKCLFVMTKEFSRMSFDSLPICKKDTDLINSDLMIKEYFEKCKTELLQLKNTIFYAPYSYFSVLKMSKKIKKLANLARNEEFVAAFESNLIDTSYEFDLRRIFDEAVRFRDNRLAVERKLSFMFGDLFPNVVIRELSENLNLQDVQQWR